MPRKRKTSSEADFRELHNHIWRHNSFMGMAKKTPNTLYH